MSVLQLLDYVILHSAVTIYTQSYVMNNCFQTMLHTVAHMYGHVLHDIYTVLL